MHENVYTNGVYRGVVTHSATSEESNSMDLGNGPRWRTSFMCEIPVTQAISEASFGAILLLWVGAAEMEEFFFMKFMEMRNIEMKYLL
jgi:hypothetical protein